MQTLTVRVFVGSGAIHVGRFTFVAPMTSARWPGEFAAARATALEIVRRAGGTSGVIAENGNPWPTWCGFVERQVS